MRAGARRCRAGRGRCPALRRLTAAPPISGWSWAASYPRLGLRGQGPGRGRVWRGRGRGRVRGPGWGRRRSGVEGEAEAQAAAAAAERSAGARAGAGRDCGGAEVAGRSETARHSGRGGPCRPCLGGEPGRAFRGRAGAAPRWSSSLAVTAPAQGPRLRTRGTGLRSEAASVPSLPPAPLPLPPRRESPRRAGRRAGRRAAGGGRQLGLRLLRRSGRRVPMATVSSSPLAPPPARPRPRGHTRFAHTRCSGAVGALFPWV